MAFRKKTRRVVVLRIYLPKLVLNNIFKAREEEFSLYILSLLSAFRSRFVEWLGTIHEYPKPFDMTFGRISELFDVNVQELFNEG